MTIKNIIFSLILLFFLNSCTKNINKSTNILDNMDNLKNISQNQWDELAKKKIFFGHQSVGYNMIDGVENILKENPNLKINIIKGHDTSIFQNPVFAHDNNGSNRDPKLKIDAFFNLMDDDLGDQVDIAGFKFCYVDIEEESDFEEIFNHYKKKMNEIALKYPKVKIIHFTVPIKSLQSGLKGFLKKILGKDIGIKDNIARQQFNDLLLEEFKNQPIFDLAKVESTYPDGKREFTIIDNEKIYTMVPAYTNDGGHLSEKGKIIIGRQLLVFLSKL